MLCFAVLHKQPNESVSSVCALVSFPAARLATSLRCRDSPNGLCMKPACLLALTSLLEASVPAPEHHAYSTRFSTVTPFQARIAGCVMVGSPHLTMQIYAPQSGTNLKVGISVQSWLRHAADVTRQLRTSMSSLQALEAIAPRRAGAKLARDIGIFQHVNCV